MTKHAVRLHFDVFGPIQVTREKDEYDKNKDLLTVVLTIRDSKSSRYDKHNKILISDAFRGDSLLIDLFAGKEKKGGGWFWEVKWEDIDSINWRNQNDNGKQYRKA